MLETLLQTKLYIPPLRPGLVSRQHLLARLDRALQADCRLTLVSAPAGYGKTTLVSAWVQQVEQPVAWLSLDESDNDPVRFLAYVIAALKTINPALGEPALAFLTSPQQPPVEVLLTSLLNTFLGILSVTGGMLDLAGMDGADGAIFLIVLGGYLVLKPYFDRRELFGRAEVS